MLESFFWEACYIRDVVYIPSRERLLKANEEIFKWFPYGGNHLQNRTNFHTAN